MAAVFLEIMSVEKETRWTNFCQKGKPRSEVWTQSPWSELATIATHSCKESRHQETLSQLSVTALFIPWNPGTGPLLPATQLGIPLAGEGGSLCYETSHPQTQQLIKYSCTHDSVG